LNAIWNGEPFRQFRRKMLDGIRNVCRVRADSSIIKHRLFPEDILNGAAEGLKRFYD
jgi:hypothetical protein